MKIHEFLTIVIPCKNESDLILNTLWYLNEQINIKNTEVIISDSSNDDTVDIIKSSDSFPNLKISIIKGGTPSIARNNGFRFCRTPYVLFIDADMELRDQNTINQSITKIFKEDLHLVTCNVRCEGKYFYVYPIFEFFRNIMSIKYPFAVGGFMLFKSIIFNKIGRFNEGDLFAEDFNLSMKISPNKFSVVNSIIHTSDRRFRKKGLFYMVKMAILSAINRGNPQFFKQDHGYWI
jgi:glycosyltransferase involved in cell wall biosynthesis